MKKLLQLTLLLLAILLPATSGAYDFMVDGIYYERVFGTNNVNVVAKSYGSIDNNTFYSGNVIIPSTVTYNQYTYSVVSIGWAAFRGCRDVTSVTIPNTVTSISDAAFLKCSGLTSINIPNSVTTIGRSAFCECTGLMSITIPNSVTSIGEEAFDDTAWYNNQPDGLVYYGSWAYKYKGTMPEGTSITLNIGTHAIASGAFKNCTGLTNINIPNSVILIDKYAFSNCTGLTSVTIPNSVMTISNGAFMGCAGLTSVTIPSSVTTIGNSAFSDCSSLRTLNYNAVCCSDFGSIYSPFDGLNISTINFGNTVQKIPAYFAQSLKSLTSITIGNSVDSIGQYAFSNCTGLTSVNFSNHVKFIGNYVFNYCTGLTSITIPNSVTSIGVGTFYNCTGLTSVHITDLEAWCKISFESSPLYYAHHLFLNDEEIKDLVIPSTITSIKKYAFQGCIGLTSVTIPNSVKSIGARAFSLCSGLTSVNFGNNSVKSIDFDAFYGCSGLSNISLPNSVTSIGDNVFSNCTGLTSINIPNSVTSIGHALFIGCTALDTLYYNAVSCTDFDNTTATYRPFYNSNISTIIIGDNVLRIPANFANSLTLLSNLTIGNSVTSIGQKAFYNCKKLTNANIGNNVTSIEREVFSGCSDLANVSIPNSVTFIGQEAFNGCSNLTSINIPNSVTSFGYSVFSGCDELASITVATDNQVYDSRNNCNAIVETETNTLIAGCKNTFIPNSVSSIGNGAFRECKGLTSIVIPNSVTSISNSAFYNCSGLNEVFSSIEDPSYISMGSSVFYRYPNNYDSRILYVPYGSSATYQGDTNWSQYFGSIDEIISAYWIDLNEDVVDLSEGEMLQLIATVLPDDATNKAVTWDSSDEAVATVDQNGLVTAVGAGIATITATTVDGSELRASCTVTVVPNFVLATSITLNQTSAHMIEGETVQLTATVLPEDATDKSVTWTSSDVAVATVDQNGLVTAVGAGVATIIATTVDVSNLTASCTVTVEPNVVLATSIELNQTSANVNEGETLQLTATVMPEDATDKTVTWASSDETVATVDQNGLVTAVAAGTATITASTIDGSDLSASCEVTVNGIATVNNMLGADALSARCGEEKQLAVRMDNESLITALQCDIYLPEGISIATEDGDYLIDLVPARKATNHTVSTNDLPNGAIRLFITSATSKPFKGNSGDLFILNLVVDGDAESGEYSLDLRNIILSDTEAHPYYVPDLNVPVTIMDYIKGDVNIDGTVNVSDYVATANYILELDPHPFLFVAADIDENLAINVSDLVGVANIALNFMGAPAVNHAPAMGYDGDGLMSFTADCSTISSNKHVVTLDLSNSSAVTAFQMDINLPEGLKLVNASLSDRATASHSLEMTTLASGAYRLLGASMMSKAFVGSEGTLLTLEIEGATSGMAIIDGIMLAEPDATLHKHDAMTLAFDNSGVQEMMSDVSIYLQDGMVVVESPVASKVQFILPNGMSVVHEVKPGRNIYNTGLEGVVIVKVGSQVKKFKL